MRNFAAAQGNTTVKAGLASDAPQSLAASSSPSGTAVATSQVPPISSNGITPLESTSSVSQIVRRKWCGRYAIGSDDFSHNVVGAKSVNTQELKVSAGRSAVNVSCSFVANLCIVAHFKCIILTSKLPRMHIFVKSLQIPIKHL